MKRYNRLTVLILVFAAAVLPTFCGNYTVVVHPQNPVTQITVKNLQKIYLGEKITWPNKEPIKVAALKEGDIHKAFLKDIVKINANQFFIFWKRKIFTGSGTGTYIRFFKSDENIKEFIRQNPEAIGYISTTAVDNSVKKVDILEPDRVNKDDSDW